MKKKITTYLLLAIACLGLHSCLFQEEDYFDDSSANRASADVVKCSEILKSAPNGWMFEYYIGEEYELGGITLFCKFDNQKVAMASSMAPGKSVVSLYKVVSEQSTMLSFDTYNELIHIFGRPLGSGNNPNGNLGGDYEFIIMSASADKIVLKGKKYNNWMVMTPVADNLNWDEYIAAVNKVENEAFLDGYNLMIDGKKAGMFERSDYTFYTSYTSEAGKIEEGHEPFIYTPEGLRFREPISIGGKTMQHFIWNEPEQTFSCSDAGSEGVKLVGFYPEGYSFYEDYIGNYTLTCMKKTGTSLVPTTLNVSLAKNVEGQNYIMKGLTANFVVDFNKSAGSISIGYQRLGKVGSYFVELTFGTKTGYYPGFAGLTDMGLNGRIDSTSPLTLSLVDNGVYRVATSLIFCAYFEGVYDDPDLAGSLAWYDSITLTKK